MSKTAAINRLVVNGCSYMHSYASGFGHKELANKLGIPSTVSLARPGSSNQRIVRTTLHDGYNNEKTLYVIGATFLHRYELPILVRDNDHNDQHLDNGSKFQWINDQSPFELGQLDDGITSSDVKQFHKLKTKFDLNSEPELVCNTMYAYTSMIDSLIANGHSVVMFNTAEVIFRHYANNPDTEYAKNYTQMVENLQWLSNEYQYANGAKSSKEDMGVDIPQVYKHVAPGEHKYLNDFLYGYIDDNNLYV